jgi:hypothetical protein
MTLESDVLIVLGFTALVVAGIFVILKWTKNKTRRVSTLRIYIQAVAVVYVFMGLIIGPFNTPLWAPLGVTPRDRLVGGDFFGNQFPDGLSVPILACYYPNGEDGDLSHLANPSLRFPVLEHWTRLWSVVFYFGFGKTGHRFRYGYCGLSCFGQVFLRVALSIRLVHGSADSYSEIYWKAAFEP